MNNEEEIMKEVNKLFVTMANVHIDGKPMADLLKLYNSKKEEMYAIAKTNYTVGMLEERDSWYKKINELLDTINVRIDYLKTELSKISIEIEKGAETEIDNLSTLEYYYEEELKCRENQKNILQELIGKEE